jgi:hypothetical protein
VTSQTSPPPPFHRDALLLLAVSWGARLLFVALVPTAAHSLDVDHWMEVSALLENGINPYSATGYLNWPPVWMQSLYLIGTLARTLGLPFLTVLQACLIAVESALLLATLGLARRLLSPTDARRAVLFGLALNPIAILLVCQHGNFDVIVALWIVLFVAALERFHRDRDPVDWLAACAFLGLGILTKTVPVVLLPLLSARWREIPRRARWLGLALVLGPVLLGLSIIYALAPEGVTANVLRYRSLAGWFGISGLLGMVGATHLEGLYGSLFNLFLAAVLIFTGWTLARRESVEARDLVLTAMLLPATIPALGPGYGPQYVHWFLPLLAVLFFTYDIRWRRVVGAWAAVAVVTYLVEYGLFPSHGMFLVHLTEGAEPLRGWSQSVSDQTGQTLLRLPLFVAYLGLLAGGVALLRQRLSGLAQPR